ncbi:acyltransferase-domain-containing protein [Coniophora puteana RWD-64-598 SS2]|uniref:1-acyl-sn-glycerol-3-phosphate acyltransferase n=1 Tax=Coniophora puteana (strain RWD-64-598) TaxID=741705 RepID=A0A5M3MAU8_CONPW|nr:acyltransferase-domain-containing protein [Coniophora puteana RWD-64-598 SS2]EIW76203.1 acyltransferase-domain-containing protein [Coniophora puteana RWD-64-598 SS2]
MSFLFACLIKPLAYLSLPILLARYIHDASPAGRYYVRVGIYLGCLSLVSTAGVFIAAGMSLIGRRDDVNFVVARCFYALASRALDIHVEIEGEEHLQEARPALMVSNHQSMLDVLFLARSFPRQASIMAKKELQWSPLGPWMYMSGAVFIDRGNHARAQRSLEAAGEEIKRRGVFLHIFPEGTRHMQEAPGLLPFKKGAFNLAVQAQIPVVPVVFENYWRGYRSGVLGTGTFKVRVLPPIPTAGLSKDDVADLTTRVRDTMLEALRDISVPVPAEVKADEPLAKTGLPAKEEVPSEASKSAEQVVPVPSAEPSEGSSSEAASPDLHRSRTLKEGSEYGAETDDEGNVLIGRTGA